MKQSARTAGENTWINTFASGTNEDMCLAANTSVWGKLASVAQATEEGQEAGGVEGASGPSKFPFTTASIPPHSWVGVTCACATPLPPADVIMTNMAAASSGTPKDRIAPQALAANRPTRAVSPLVISVSLLLLRWWCRVRPLFHRSCRRCILLFWPGDDDDRPPRSLLLIRLPPSA